MTEWEKFYGMVKSCHKKLVEEELDLKETEEISDAQFIDIMQLYYRCYYKKLGYVSDKRFNNLISETGKSIEDMSGKIEDRQLKYASKFLEPKHLIEQVKFTEKINDRFINEIGDALESEDTRLISRMFILSFYNNLAYDIILNLLTPLIDVISIANDKLGLGQDWAVSLLAVGLQEALVKSKLREFEFEPTKRETFHKLGVKLREKLEESEERLNMDVLLTDGFRNVRHLIVHDPVKWTPDENEANEIVRHTLNLASVLYPDDK
jgi:hypothetical protein